MSGEGDPVAQVCRVAVPDLVSSSFFPVLAAARAAQSEPGDVRLELEQLYPVSAAARALRDGVVDFLAGPAHGPLSAFPEWSGCTILMALSQRTYWVLVGRLGLALDPADIASWRDLTIAAAPGPGHALERLFLDAGVDRGANGIDIRPLPDDASAEESFGLRAAAALRDGTIDAFWANTMAAEIAVHEGVGQVVLDPRRGQGPPESAHYTFSALVTTQEVLDTRPDDVRAVVAAVVRAQQQLRERPERAREVADGLFPELEASLISGLVERDTPYYDPTVSDEAFAGLTRFTEAMGLTSTEITYDDVVSRDVRDLWTH
jgi:hypothetical protein